MGQYLDEVEKAASEDNDGLNEVSTSFMRPSSTGYCHRQMFLQKLGVKEFSDYVRGILLKGSQFHAYMENQNREMDGREAEVYKELETDMGVKFGGSADVVDHENQRIVDYKTRNGGMEYIAQEPKEKDVDQIHTYMKIFGMEKATLVYVNIREFNESGKVVGVEHEIEFDPERWRAIKAKVKDVLDTIENFEAAEEFTFDKSMIPYGKCGCYYCEQESDDELDFDRVLKVES